MMLLLQKLWIQSNQTNKQPLKTNTMKQFTLSPIVYSDPIINAGTKFYFRAWQKAKKEGNIKAENEAFVFLAEACENSNVPLLYAIEKLHDINE